MHRIGMTDIEQLRTKYRTHSGILNVTPSIVDLLHRFFPDRLDVLEEVKALFVGPPLLLFAISSDDLTILLSSPGRKSLQAGILAACLPPSFQEQRFVNKVISVSYSVIVQLLL